MNGEHPVRFSVEYPDRPLNRLSTAFRVFTVIPIAIVLGSIGGYTSGDFDGGDTSTVVTSPIPTRAATSTAGRRWSSGCSRSRTTSCWRSCTWRWWWS